MLNKKFTVNINEDLLINLKVFAVINRTTVKDYILSLVNKDMKERNICIYNYSHNPNKETISALQNPNMEKVDKVESIWD